MSRFSVSLLFEPHDLWVGVYWTRRNRYDLPMPLHIYVCIVPMFPILVRIR